LPYSITARSIETPFQNGDNNSEEVSKSARFDQEVPMWFAWKALNILLKVAVKAKERKVKP